MLSALLDLVIDAVVSAFGWLLRVVRGAFGGAAVDAAATTAEMTGSRRDRRRLRRHFKALADAGQTDELIRAYRQLGRSDQFRAIRLDALETLVDHSPTAAAPLLREVLEGPEDTWMLMGVLHLIGKHRVFELADSVTTAERDPRPVVAESAAVTRKRLAAG